MKIKVVKIKKVAAKSQAMLAIFDWPRSKKNKRKCSTPCVQHGQNKSAVFFDVAQRSGFEPEVAFTTHAFQACTLDRSDTSANGLC